MLEHIFGSKTRVKLLNIFFSSPERSFYVRELARAAETQLNAVRREIANLLLVGVIVPVPPGETVSDDFGTERSKYYKLDASSLIFPELKALLLKAKMLEEQEFIEEMKRKAGDVSFFLLTGVFTDAKDVGTDILLVGTVKPVVVAKIVKEFEKVMGSPLRYTVMESKEFVERREIGDKFLYNIFEAKHMVVVNKFAID